MFGVADIESLLELPGYLLDEMAELAMALNGMAPEGESIKAAEKNSETPSSSDGSPSPIASGDAPSES